MVCAPLIGCRKIKYCVSYRDYSAYIPPPNQGVLRATSIKKRLQLEPLLLYNGLIIVTSPDVLPRLKRGVLLYYVVLICQMLKQIILIRTPSVANMAALRE